MASTRVRSLENGFIQGLINIWVFKESRRKCCWIILFKYDFPGTNQITLNLFTPDKSMKHVPGISSRGFVPEDNYTVTREVVPHRIDPHPYKHTQ